MPNHMQPFLLGLAVAVCAVPAFAADALRLPNRLSSHMVVQRAQPLVLSGWDKPGQVVAVEISADSGATAHSQKATTTADAGGCWRVTMQPVPVGGPYTITITGSSMQRLIDVLSGDVWLCAGQSNMAWPMDTTLESDKEIPLAGQHSQMRLLRVPQAGAHAPADDIDAVWSRCTPATVRYFSAVGYYFGKRLQAELGVPIGLIQAAAGGSIIEAWMSLDALGALSKPAQLERIEYLQSSAQEPYARRWKAYLASYTPWMSTRGRLDAGIAPEAANWATDPAGAWRDIQLPAGKPAEMLKGNGAFWFRREVVVPDSWVGKDLAVSLGGIRDTDVTWWNGQAIGQTPLTEPGAIGRPRVYRVPGRLVQAKNHLVLRVYGHSGNTGLLGPDVAMWAEVRPSGGERIPLAGAWQCRVEKELPSISETPPVFEDSGDKKTASMLYHAMLHPLLGMGLRGVIFYQGESNSQHPRHVAVYAEQFPGLIRSWRQALGRDDLPFLFVQLPNLKPPLWPEFRESQRAALQTAHTGMVVAIDLGKPAAGLHPLNKKPFGERLALLALQRVYQREVLGSSPMPAGATVQGATVRIRMDDARGLRRRGGQGEVQGFELADADGHWHPAQAEVRGNEVEVHSPAVAKPAAVRYAWTNDPAYPLLENDAGLPLTPFRDILDATIPVAKFQDRAGEAKKAK